MRILVVETGAGRAQQVHDHLDRAAPGVFDVIIVESLAQTVATLLGVDRPRLDAIVVDLQAGAPDEALQILEQVRTAAFETPVVVYGTTEIDDALALACIRAGAQDVVTGPALARALRHAKERKQRENALARQALQDPLTKLPNRTLFLDRLRQALNRLGRTHSCLAVLFLDLDTFKAINDAHGHAAGDALLVDVAGRLTATLRGGDTAARIGGDEFVVLCEDIAGSDEARTIGTRLLAELPVRASMGIAVAGDGAIEPEHLVRNADAAMYAVKRAGGNAVRLAQ